MTVLFRGNIFVHVPKTGGSSISDVLMQQPGALQISRHGNSHFPPGQLDKALGGRFANFRSFCFVRDPVTWFPSLYRYLHATPTHGHPAKAMAASELMFPDFVQTWCGGDPDFYLQSHYLSPALTRIYRFEKLTSAWNAIAKVLKITTPLPVLNASTPDDGTCIWTKDALEAARRAEGALLRVAAYPLV